MKGVLFSADFVKDNNGNLRLLELNTDTGIINTALPQIDFTDFYNVLVSSSISEIHVIHKPAFHSKFVNYLSQSINQNLPNITKFVEYKENINSIYPINVVDANNRFILRLSYDESAILDSTYTKDRFELYKLYTDNSESTKIASFYYSSSYEFIDNLDRNINLNNIPDAVIKDRFELHNPIKFYKIGTGSSEETQTEKWNGFINSVKNDTNTSKYGILIEQYHHNQDELVDNYITSIRNLSIVYGSNLDLINILTYKVQSLFELPITLEQEVSQSEYVNKLKDTHYYEYTTNYIKDSVNGFFGDERILMEDGTWKELKNVELSDKITSYFISGSPDFESNSPNYIDPQSYSDWSSIGSIIPSGSFITSSEVVFKDSNKLKYGALIETVVDSDSVLSSIGKRFLAYESSSNLLKFKGAFELDKDVDYLYDMNGNIIDIDEVNLFITEETDVDVVELDVESTDTYILSGSTAFQSLITHNAPCFVKGTKILTIDGEKNIEDIKIGELVLTYNHRNKVNEYQKVNGIFTKKEAKTVKYFFEDGKRLECTLDHPIYSIQRGYISYDPILTKSKYGLDVNQVKIGDLVLLNDENEIKITDIRIYDDSKPVFNLNSIEKNSNFYANNILVHNRCFAKGTKILIEGNVYKNIEDIKIGDVISNYNLEKNIIENAKVGDLKKHNVDKVIKLYFEDNIIITTDEHPFYEKNKGWICAKDIIEGDIFLDSHLSSKQIIKKELIYKPTIVYNLLSVSPNNNFFANDILVHNK